MKRYSARLIAAALVMSGMALLPSRAMAASGNPLSTLPVFGTIAAGSLSGANGATPTAVKSGTLAGFFTVDNFTAQGNQLLARGTLTGMLALVDPTGNAVPAQPVTQTNVALPLAIEQGASCQLVHLAFGPLDLTLLGLIVHPNQMTLDITPQSAPGTLLGTLLCNIANLLANKNPSANAVVAQLQQVLQALNGVSPLQNIGMLGSTTTGSFIPGTFSITNFAGDPNSTPPLTATGTFAGIAPDASGQPASSTQPLTVPVTVGSTSSCQVLHLTLGPLNQSLLGQMANLTPVSLEITTQQLPGSLLCGITPLLNGNDSTGLAELLNQISSALQATPSVPAGGGTASKTIPVSLTAADGQQFTGNLTLTNFMTENNALFVNGRLAGKLTGPTGNTASQINQPVQMIPVTPSQSSCQSLTLNLGPLNLSLLGLAVYLSPVQMVITAPTGANNQVENLLCSVANSLNNQQSLDLNTLVPRLNQLLNTLA